MGYVADPREQEYASCCDQAAERENITADRHRRSLTKLIGPEPTKLGARQPIQSIYADVLHLPPRHGPFPSKAMHAHFGSECQSVLGAPRLTGSSQLHNEPQTTPL